MALFSSFFTVSAATEPTGPTNFANSHKISILSPGMPVATVKVTTTMAPLSLKTLPEIFFVLSTISRRNVHISADFQWVARLRSVFTDFSLNEWHH